MAAGISRISPVLSVTKKIIMTITLTTFINRLQQDFLSYFFSFVVIN